MDQTHHLYFDQTEVCCRVNGLPSSRSVQGLGGFLVYPAAATAEPQTTANFRLPTPLDDQGSSSSLRFGGSSQGYPVAGEGLYDGLCHPCASTASFASSLRTASTHSGYDASSLEPTWSPITPLTPSGVDSTVTCFLEAGSSFRYPEDLTSHQSTTCNMTGMARRDHIVPSVYAHPEIAARLSASDGDFMSQDAADQPTMPRGKMERLSSEETDASPTGLVGLKEEPEAKAQPTPEKTTTRRKRMSTTELTKRGRRGSSASNESTRQTQKPGQTLRTATRRNRRAEPTVKPGESLQEQRARASHNLVEKEYRNRLHGYFERLLNVLPGEGIRLEGEEEASAGQGTANQGQHKRLSKAEVLEKARLHIQYLEDERAKLKREIAELALAKAGSAKRGR